MNKLLVDVNLPIAMKREAEIFFKNVFDVSLEDKIAAGSTHMKNEFMNKFHNPLNINNLLENYGFSLQKNYFYHYHVLPSHFERLDPELYHRLSLALENRSDWRGHIMASAFVSECKKTRDWPG